ncbi:hypothetical protein KOR42_47050 [Thalassoglobus neptunius]|uniref:Uncharacterized protein n=1 Tax=Thalassoglobus neptunius TaxID=1938619 RepID=A0A5C5VVB3_9PLAN|nr:hypothetical protein [Thalassoglobus neptunius]TWT42596.1 hypothetical protein KOR42_47050 [Thalassoglobus neptunius]
MGTQLSEEHTPSAPTTIGQIDAQKLHAESLQLRSQQFFLSTVALAGAGLSAWVGPGLAGLTESTIGFFALFTATACWLGLLAFLYEWTLILRRLIHVIGWYLQLNDLSDWEKRFRAFTLTHQGKIDFLEPTPPDKYIRSQNDFYFWAFVLYGVVAWTGGFVVGESRLWPLEAISYWKAEQLFGASFFGLLIVAYLVTLHRRRTRNEAENQRIADDWPKFLKEHSLQEPPASISNDQL